MTAPARRAQKEQKQNKKARGAGPKVPSARNRESTLRNPKPGKGTAPERVAEIMRGLDRLYPHVQCGLRHADPWQLLVATILSAQCTDQRVNQVTPQLFGKYPTVYAFARLEPEDLEPDIHSTGFFRNKARSIVGAARKIVSEFAGRVPDAMGQILTLPGVARKTANVVLGTAYGKSTGVVVDTHVHRIARRLDLTRQNTPEKIEQDLMKIIPKRKWIEFGHQIIWHGRQLCIARRPRCGDCLLDELCYAPDKWKPLQ